MDFPETLCQEETVQIFVGSEALHSDGKTATYAWYWKRNGEWIKIPSSANRADGTVPKTHSLETDTITCVVTTAQTCIWNTTDTMHPIVIHWWPTPTHDIGVFDESGLATTETVNFGTRVLLRWGNVNGTASSWAWTPERSVENSTIEQSSMSDLSTPPQTLSTFLKFDENFCHTIYDDHITLWNALGCKHDVCAPVRIVGSELRGQLVVETPVARPNRETAYSICTDDEVRLIAKSMGGTNNYNYVWSYATGDYSAQIELNPASLPAGWRLSANHDTLIAPLAESTRFYVTVSDKVTSGNAPWTDMETIIVNEFVDMNARLKAIKDTACEDELIIVNLEVDAMSLGDRNWSIRWYKNNLSTEVTASRNENVFTNSDLNDGDKICAVAYTGLMCAHNYTDTTEWLQVKIHPLPIIHNLSPKDTFICNGNKITLSVEATTIDNHPLTYHWSPLGASDTDGGPTLTTQPTGSNASRAPSHFVTVENTVTGCQAQGEFIVEVIDKPQLVGTLPI
jgi:hypothetical protein